MDRSTIRSSSVFNVLEWVGKIGAASAQKEGGIFELVFSFAVSFLDPEIRFDV
jgi:hypothetical protein